MIADALRLSVTVTAAATAVAAVAAMFRGVSLTIDRIDPAPAASEDEAFLAPHERAYSMYEPFLSLLDVEVPTIAAMQGHAIDMDDGH